MENNNTGSRSEKFFAGKGFYIALTVCVLIIGASIISLISSTDKKADIDADMTLMENKPVEEPEISEESPSLTIEEMDTENTETVGTWSQGDVWTEPGSWTWPVSGDIEREYSVDALAYDVTMADWRTHNGIDILAEQGDVVVCAADGTVEDVYVDDMYGTTVVVSHFDGLKTVYGNLAETPNVSVGDSVKAGDIIGSVGNTALCEVGEPSHIHFAVTKSGESADPLEYLSK